MATPEGWRHSVVTEDGARLCGRLPGERADAEAAREAATSRLVEIAREFHGIEVEVTWEHTEPGTWTGRVVRGGGAEDRAD
ncbi:hypothetical protein [Streptomyces sp. NPDC005438]|uniref:hypothetical protein n=1 Tax=Streptomyces sp. NPDC005438 TaxID=3156880 RepID=UPI00339ECCD0